MYDMHNTHEPLSAENALPVESVPQAPDTAPDAPAVPAMSDAEVSTLAKRLAQEYGERLDYLTSEKRRREYPTVTPEEQYTLAVQKPCQATIDGILRAPLHSLTWLQCEDLQMHDPALFLRKWEQIKAEARQELEIGMTASQAVESAGLPWERAQFVALRQDFAAEWNPRGGIEWNLIDQMAQAYTMVLYWQKIMLRWMNLDAYAYKDAAKDKTTPRLSTFEAVSRAADMVDKFQRMFMRVLRALGNMRKINVVVQNAGQVNVGQQQVNVGPQTA